MRILVALLTFGAVLPMASAAGAQTRSVRDTTTAYGARLDAKGTPVETNRTRIDSRLRSRIDNRLSLRLERYRPDTARDPAAAFRVNPDTDVHFTPVVPSTSQ